MKLVSPFALLLAVVSLFSCNEIENTVPDNNFSLGENTFKIIKGAFLKGMEPGTDTDGNEYYRNELILAGEGIMLTETDGHLVGTGQGSFVNLLINNKGRELEAGTYTWQSEENEQPFDLWAGYVTIDWQKDSEIKYELGSGTLTIVKSGTTYKTSFEGIRSE